MEKDLLIKDLEKNLNVKINEVKIIKEEKNLVLNLDDKYILKELTERDLKALKEFELYYKFVSTFRKSIYLSDEYNYVVYDYIEEDRNVDYDKIKIFNQVYDLIKEERRIEDLPFGYLYEDNKTFYEFLEDEINYSASLLDKDINIDMKLIQKALKIVKKEKVTPYLLHGDLGVHNFLVKDKKIIVIDPMVLVGDYLYDFYSALLSDYSIAKDLDFDYILSYFDRKEKYKKALFIIVYYIRLCRSYKYDRASYDGFLKDFKYLALK